jgi:hypothetical protein
VKAGAQKNGKSISDKETTLIKLLGPVAKAATTLKHTKAN